MILTSALVMFFAGIIHCYNKEEPKCYSRFDWEDKLLEKTIRTELSMQKYQQSMEKIMEEIRAHKKEFEAIKIRYNQTVEELKTGVETQMNNMVQTVTQLKDKIQTPTVMFNARTVADYSPPAGQIMIFPAVQQNIGDAYDKSTGIFTSPVNGTYIFSLQLCVYSSKWAQIQIAVDRTDNKILTFRHYNADSSDAMATSIAHYLTQGQKVWVQSYTNAGSSSILFEDTNTDCGNQFSGALVHH